MSECGLVHNFIDQTIADAGGFSVEIGVAEINTADAGTDFLAGFGVGFSGSRMRAFSVSPVNAWQVNVDEVDGAGLSTLGKLQAGVFLPERSFSSFTFTYAS